MIGDRSGKTRQSARSWWWAAASAACRPPSTSPTRGFKVYLCEEGTAIGGRMAQLDKTFPTNDCSMCIISPKLVETARHLNIELMCDTEVRAVVGRRVGSP